LARKSSNLVDRMSRLKSTFFWAGDARGLEVLSDPVLLLVVGQVHVLDARVVAVDFLFRDFYNSN
jgi:hypothetical protein